MRETESQHEPSMEEILASIRRIISEDDGGKADAADARADEDDDAIEADDIDDATDGEEEPVELTRMVDAAGQVVDLTDGGKDAAADDDGRDEAAEAAKEGEDKVSSKQAAEKTEANETEESEAGEEAVALVDKALNESAAVAPAPDDRGDRDDEPENEGEGLVSSHTKKAAAASLAQVISAVAVPEARPHPVGGERTLEAVVRDALQPELRHWLDQNLSPLVERIVREEIKKLVRRVEDR